MFGWLQKRRRRKLMTSPFPATWETYLAHNARFTEQLSPLENGQLREAIQVFVAEKNWEGCAGLVVTDEHRVTIAAQMARMILYFENEYFDQVLSILIYPNTYLAKSTNQMGSGVIVEGDSGRLGEAWYRGPVILSWADVLATAHHLNQGHNVVIHEFAHQLDMRNGRTADGVPTIESATVAERWLQVMPRAFEKLGHMCREGLPSVLDCYGATSPAEFFAVASESYFEQPSQLAHQWPAVFELLDTFYRKSENV
jgi:Mlc titration factor MtfA (ptsG expression regulator)